MGQLKRQNEISTGAQKILLLIFSLGPVLFIIWFLSSKGFFDSTSF